MGVGALGGYVGAHMAKAGEDVTFIDPWPEHVEQMRTAGLRISHLREVPEFTVKVRALHLTDVQQLIKEQPIDVAFVCVKSYDTAWATMLNQPVRVADRLRRVAAELHERGDHCRSGRLGVVSREHSSGGKIRRGASTKSGNTHLRRMIVEAAWHYRHRPGIRHGLGKRQAGLSEEVRAIAWKAQLRLTRRYWQLAAQAQASGDCGGRPLTAGLYLGHRHPRRNRNRSSCWLYNFGQNKSHWTTVGDAKKSTIENRS
jgi:hypothetical protein